MDRSAAGLNAPRRCGLPRRLGCLAYDLLVLAAVLMLASLPAVLANRGALRPGLIGYQLYLAALAAGYYIGFWARGQTPGMRAWHVRLSALDGAPLAPDGRWRRLAIRWLAGGLDLALLGAGWWWSLAHPQRLTLADRLSGTRLVVDHPWRDNSR